MLFGLDFLAGQGEPVIQGDRKQRLDKHRLARPGPVLHDPLQPGVKIRSNRDNKTVIPNRNILIGNDVSQLGRTQLVAQAPLNLVPQGPHAATQCAQGRTGLILQATAVVEAAPERLFQGRQGGQAGRQVGQWRVGLGMTLKELGQLA